MRNIDQVAKQNLAAMRQAEQAAQNLNDLGTQLTRLIVDEAEGSDLAKTDWVLVARSAAVLGRPALASAPSDIEAIPGLAVWTDDYNNLFRILK